MEYRRSTPDIPLVVFDQVGQQILCRGISLEDLALSANGVSEVRAIKLEGKLTGAMRKVVDNLYALASMGNPIATNEVEFGFACCALSDAYNYALIASGMHILAGVSPSSATLLIVFAPRSIDSCIAQAI